MSLPTPQLDTRTFQDLVDQAKKLIPHYCPEWTDHNVSDPGVTLIELFAWMTDLLLYRVNQVPERVYIKFLELIGVQLQPPRAASAPVTFYLSAPQQSAVTIPADTEVATVRTETNPPVLFTTETDLNIRPVTVQGAFTPYANGQSGDTTWTYLDIHRLGRPGQEPLVMFPQLAPGKALYLALAEDHSHHVITLVLECDPAAGAGIDPENPPVEWQVAQDGPDLWVACEVEYDHTDGFNRSGEITLHLPAMSRREFPEAQIDHQPMHAYWLCCRLTNAQAHAEAYNTSPILKQIRVEARGGTVSARHAITIRNELIGRSDGKAGQRFKLLHTPILSRDPAHDHLIIEPPGGEAEIWQEVPDFADSGPHDRHFTLDSLDGTLMLGPELLQPDGELYQFGAIPPAGSILRFRRYQHSGGVAGNVLEGMLSVLKTSIPYVSRVINRKSAENGQDAQSLQDALLRVPHYLRTRTRAVTADDYEYLASQVPYVARAHCLAPGAYPGSSTEPQPGQVVVLIIPEVAHPDGRIPPEGLNLSADLRHHVLTALDTHSLLCTRLEVRAPQYIWVSVQVRLRLAAGSDPTLQAEVEQHARSRLYRYLNPHVGGATGNGWSFGRDLMVSEIYSLLQTLPAIEFVESVQMGVSHPGSNTPLRPVQHRLTVPRDSIICSDQHSVIVIPGEAR